MNPCPTHLGVLGPGDVDKGLGGGLDNVQEFHDGGTIVGDGHLTAHIHHQLIHTTGTQGGSNRVTDGKTSVDVREELALSLGRVSPFLEDDDLGLLWDRGYEIISWEGW